MVSKFDKSIQLQNSLKVIQWVELLHEYAWVEFKEVLSILYLKPPHLLRESNDSKWYNFTHNLFIKDKNTIYYSEKHTSNLDKFTKFK